MRQLCLPALILSFLVCADGFCGDPIWERSANGDSMMTSQDKLVDPTPGPCSFSTRRYTLAQVNVTASHGNPGTIDEITTYFMDDAVMPFVAPFDSLARFNFFDVETLDDGVHDPDMAVDDICPVTISYNMATEFIEVRATGLAKYKKFIASGSFYFVGLTPVTSNFDVILVFGGNHAMFVDSKNSESPSMFRETAPSPGGWVSSGLYAAIEIRGIVDSCDFKLGDVNQDGQVNLLDVAPFIDLISMGEFSCEADINGDGVVNLLDVDPFIVLLSG